MKRLRTAVLLTLTVLLMGLLQFGAANAHDSTYRGHGTDGYSICTRYRHSHDYWDNYYKARVHAHHYSHLRYCAWQIHPDEHAVIYLY